MRTKLLYSLAVAAGIFGLVTTEAAFRGKVAERANKEENAPYSVPVKLAPVEDSLGDDEEFDDTWFIESKIIDNNGDGIKWAYDDYNGGLKVNNMFAKAGDDWAILPAVRMEAGVYTLSLTYKVNGARYPESFEVYSGDSQTIEGMTNPILDMKEVKNDSWQTATGTINVSESGETYIGLHYVTPKNIGYNLWVKDICIEGVDNTAPEMPVINNLELDGLDATLNITLPGQSIGGAELSGSVGLEVSVDDKPIELAQSTYNAGSTQTIKFTATSGSHTLKARAYVENNGTLYSGYASQPFTAVKKQPVPLPIGTIILPDADEASWCKIIDNSNDNNTWEFLDGKNSSIQDIDSQNAFCYSTNAVAADDWLVIPAYDGAENGIYELSFELGTGNVNESFEVCYGLSDSPEELQKNVILQEKDYSSAVNYVKRYNTFNVKFNHNSTENFYIAFHAVSPANKGKIYVKNIKVDKCDIIDPKPASMSIDFNGMEGEIIVTLPSEDIVDNELTASTVYADLYIDGTKEKEISGAPGSSCTIPKTLEYGNHSALLKTYVMESDTKLEAKNVIETFRVFLSTETYLTIPATFALNSNDFNNYMVTDANADNHTWEAEKDAIVYRVSRNNAGDDWIFMTKVDFPSTNQIYAVSLDYKGSYASYNEQFEVWLGDAPNPESMTRKIADIQEVKNTDYATMRENFKVDEAKKYVVGIRATSESAYALFVKNLRIENSADIPVAPDMTITESADNSNVTLSWDKVSTGECGSVLSDVKYRVSEYDIEKNEWKTLTENSDLNYVYNNSGEQRLVTLGVEAMVSDGNDTPVLSKKKIVNVMVGSPLLLPLSEKFAKGELSVSPIMFNAGPLFENEVVWAIENPDKQDNPYGNDPAALPSADATNYILKGKGLLTDAMVRLLFLKLTCRHQKVSNSNSM